MADRKGERDSRSPFFCCPNTCGSMTAAFSSPSRASSSAFPVLAFSYYDFHPARLLPHASPYTSTMPFCLLHKWVPAVAPTSHDALPVAPIPAPSLRLCSAACGRLRHYPYSLASMPTFLRAFPTARRPLVHISATIRTACRATARRPSYPSCRPSYPSCAYACRYPCSGCLLCTYSTRIRTAQRASMGGRAVETLRKSADSAVM